MTQSRLDKHKHTNAGFSLNQRFAENHSKIKVNNRLTPKLETAWKHKIPTFRLKQSLHQGHKCYNIQQRKQSKQSNKKVIESGGNRRTYNIYILHDT